MIYKINSLTNPSGATNSNFVIDSSRFKVDLEIELPLYGTAKDFEMVDTLGFTFKESISEDVESVLFRSYTSNGFPVDIDLQVYFTDSAYVKLDSMVIPNQLIIASATVNPLTGIVTAPYTKIYDATFTKARLENLKKVKHMILDAEAATYNGGTTDVKIYSDYRLDVKFGLQLQIKKKL